MTARVVHINGKNLSVQDLVSVAEDQFGKVCVVLDETAVHKIRESRKALEVLLSGGAQVYGTTTRTGPQKGLQVEGGQKFQLEIASGYGGVWGDGGKFFPSGVCRAAWVILLNQFACGTNIISLELAEELVLWLNSAWNKKDPMHSYICKIEKGASISYADLTAPMQLMRSTLAKRCLSDPTCSEYMFKSGEVLALGSSNCFTMAEAVLSLNRIERLMSLSELSAAMDIEAERSTPFIISKAAEEIAQWQEKKEVIQRIRSHLKGSYIWSDTPSSIHPFVTLRACPDIIGSVWEALGSTRQIAEGMINGHQGNPVLVGPWNSSLEHSEVGPVCSFDSTRLFIAFSNVQQALSCFAISLAQRGQHLINENGTRVSELFSRRFEVWLESSLRSVLAHGNVISPCVGRMNCAAGYDWAAPAAQAAEQIHEMLHFLTRLVGVHLLVSCAVLQHKLGPRADASIGSGLIDLFLSIQNNSFYNLDDTQCFSFENIIKVVNSYVEPLEESGNSYGEPLEESVNYYMEPTVESGNSCSEMYTLGA